jgi:fructose-1,6-bisphosphatase II
MGGEMLCRLDPQKEDEQKALEEQGTDLSRVYTVNDLIDGDDVFFAATGISGGTFLPGVRYSGAGATTSSLVMRGRTGTVRRIESAHTWNKLMRFSAVDYD